MLRSHEAGQEDSPQLRFPLQPLKDAVWGTCLDGLPLSSEELASGSVQYCFVLQSRWNDCYNTEGQELVRRDPYARQVDFTSNWCYLIHLPDLANEDTRLSEENKPSSGTIPRWNKLIIYELHVGTFATPASEEESYFDAVGKCLDHIKSLGFTAVQLMPVQEFGGMWGYNPRLTMAVHGPYGTAKSLKRLISECHRQSLTVILDIILNHGSAKLNSLWNWDGYGPQGNGGIYFEGGGETSWGKKFAFHRREVRAMLLASADLFLEGYGVDGLRFDSAHNMPESLLKDMMTILHQKYPSKILIAEVTPEDPRVCSVVGFNSCWVHANFYDAVKILHGTETQYHWDMVRAMVCGHRGFHMSHNSVVSTLGSHDQIGNRDPQVTSNEYEKYCIRAAITTHALGGILSILLVEGTAGMLEHAVGFGKKRLFQFQDELRYSLMAMSRPLPMLFMGTEILQGGWWHADKRYRFQKNLITAKDPLTLQMMALVRAANQLRLQLPELHDDEQQVDVWHEDRHNGVIGFFRKTAAAENSLGTRPRAEALIVANYSCHQFDSSDYAVKTRWTPGTPVAQGFNSQSEEFGGWSGSWTTSPWSSSRQSCYDGTPLVIDQKGFLQLKILPKFSVSVFVAL